MKIDQSTIVVTGGAGLIGSTTVDLLLREHSPRSIVIFDDFSRGVIDTKHFVYYVSFIAFGLFLTMRSVDTERWRG